MLSTPKVKYSSAVVLATLFLAGWGSPGTPLWPGSQYTEIDRSIAIQRALAYLSRSARNQRNFAIYGSDYVFCFYSIANSASDPELRAEARRRGREAAQRWVTSNTTVPRNASANDIANLVYGWLAASQLGQNDARIKPQLRRAAARFTARDFLLFDPANEHPPSDVPEKCPRDSVYNPRGATLCRKCGQALAMRSKYDVWLDALTNAYSGDRYGVPLGAPYRDVLQWLPSLRPYLDRSQTSYALFFDTVYSLTHVLYTLNDYGGYPLPRDLLPQEFSYLKRNLPEAIALHDPEMLGEFLDALKGFGLDRSDQSIQTGMTYLLETQRPDGTWSAPGETDPYNLYHSAWTGIDGLKDCCWQGAPLQLPGLRQMIEGFR